jgi:phosphoglycerate dehydrogenase-like enzyme
MTQVVVTYALEPELAEQIRAVDTRVELRVLNAGQLEALQAATPREEIATALADAEVLFGYWGGAIRHLVRAEDPPPALRWVQLSSAGADRVDTALIREAGLTFTTARGLHAVPIAEFLLTYMLMLVKGWPQLWRSQMAGEYDRSIMPGNLEGKTVGIVGMGAIGAEVARRARALGCRVLGVRRSFTERGPDAVADEAVPPGDLDYLLAESDFVVIAAPLTEETRGLIGAAQLRTMGPRSYLLNVARGELVDEAALIEALRDGTIAGAALDVFEREPLVRASPLWDLDNVILTPHVTGGVEDYHARATAIFCANLWRYLAGEPLENVVDPARGY